MDQDGGGDWVQFGRVIWIRAYLAFFADEPRERVLRALRADSATFEVQRAALFKALRRALAAEDTSFTNAFTNAVAGARDAIERRAPTLDEVRATHAAWVKAAPGELPQILVPPRAR